jgi:DNA-directed RNA polymerase subunit E"
MDNINVSIGASLTYIYFKVTMSSQLPEAIKISGVTQMARLKGDSRARKKGSNLKACRECHSLVEGEVCPVCQSSALSDDWSGYVVIVDPVKSEIAKLMGIKRPGKFALKVR